MLLEKTHCFSCIKEEGARYQQHGSAFFPGKLTDGVKGITFSEMQHIPVWSYASSPQVPSRNYLSEATSPTHSLKHILYINGVYGVLCSRRPMSKTRGSELYREVCSCGRSPVLQSSQIISPGRFFFLVVATCSNTLILENMTPQSSSFILDISRRKLDPDKTDTVWRSPKYTALEGRVSNPAPNDDIW